MTKKLLLSLLISITYLLANDGLYDYNFGVDRYNEQDYFAAEIAFANSCSKNYAKGCNALAFLYSSKKNYNQALRYYTKSCNLKNAKGCYQLFLLFKQNKNNHFKSEKALEEACNYGYKKACEQLAE